MLMTLLWMVAIFVYMDMNLYFDKTMVTEKIVVSLSLYLILIRVMLLIV